jgi:uncharacterized repeat protein (TIGR02543 family)
MPPDNPTKEGYIFNGWEGSYTNVNSDTTLTVKWREAEQQKGPFTVLFQVDGVTVKEALALNGGNAMPPVSNPTKEGFIFDGWEDGYMNVTEDRVVAAKWREITKYNVLFVVDGVTVSTQQVTQGGNATPPSTPTKDSYVFDGWEGNYTNITADTTITAKWKENTIPTFGFDPTSTNVNFLKTLGGSPLENVTPGVQVSPATDFFNGLVSLTAQSNNLKTGYAAAATTYPTNTMFSNLAAAETTYGTTMRSYGDLRNYTTHMTGSVDTILDHIFGNSGSARTTFDSELNAYRLGQYYGQKCRSNGTVDDVGSNGNAFVNALNGISGLPGVQYGMNGGVKEISNVDAILSALQARLTTQINNAMNVNGITNANDKAKIMELNGYLLTQIGEDIPQFQAQIDDMNEIALNKAYFTYNYYNDMAQANTQQVGHLMANFDPQLLKQEQEQTATRDGKGARHHRRTL